MAADTVDGPEEGRRLPVSPRQAVALLLLVLAATFGLYWFVLRTDYVPVFEGLTEGDAAAVVAELDERKVDHRLANGGTTILVAAGEADQARLNIASSELPLRGQIGFELFNESDMGLTEFAQKINYQRALQGELARTIMLFDGIDNARVHLALPERTLFRGAQSEPTAAVTLILRPGHVITAARIDGIQRLVAGSVPDLAVNAVVMVDDSGQLISASSAAPAMEAGGGEAEAVRLYYEARISSAMTAIAPDLERRVSVRVRQQSDIALDDAFEQRLAPAPAAPSEGELTASAGDTAALRVTGGADDRNYALYVTITTSVQLSAATREQLTSAVISAAQLSQNRQDRLSFAVGPMTSASQGVQATPAASRVVSRQPAQAARQASYEPSWAIVVIAGTGAALLAALAMYFTMRGLVRPNPINQIDDFAAELKSRLAASELSRG